MSNELARTQLEQSLEVTSLSDLVKQVTDNPFLLIDCSSSMGHDCPNGKTRIDNLREVVKNIQGEGPVVMIAFGGQETSQPRFVDHVPEQGGGTPLHAAIRLAKEHGATRVVVISDGEPDMRVEACNAGKELGRVDVVFVGTPGSTGSFFLDELAKLTGGTRTEGNLHETKQITSAIIGLLVGEVEEQRAPIQGEGFSAVESDGDDAEDDDEEDEEEDDEDENA